MRSSGSATSPSERAHPLNRQRLVGVLVIALAAAVATHALVRTASHGAAVGHDQVAYLSVAENLAAGNGLVMFNGRRLWAWPPFYPAAMAVPIWLGGEPAEVGRWLNALAFGVLVCVVGLWLRGQIRSPVLIVGGVVAVAVSPDLNGLAANLRSDMLFALLAFVALVLLSAFLRQPAGRCAWALLFGAAVFASCAALTRYAGVVLVLVALPLLLARPGKTLVRSTQAITFAILSGAPVAFVAVGNDAGGRLQADMVSVAYLLGHMRDVFLFWALPAAVPGWLQALFWGWLAVAALGLAALAARGRVLGGQSKPRGAGPLPSYLAQLPFQPIGVFAAFLVVYLAFHCAAAWAGPAGSSYWEIKRFLAAVYAPLVCLAALLGQRLLAARRAGWAKTRRVLSAAVALAFLAHAGLAARANMKTTIVALEHGYTKTSYNAAYWDGSATLNHLRAQPPPGKVISTDHALLWWHSGLSAAAARHQWLPPGIGGLVGKLQGRPRPAYFVWLDTFHGINAPYNRFVHLMPGWEAVARLADGGVYRVPAGWRFDADEWQRRLRRWERWPS